MTQELENSLAVMVLTEANNDMPAEVNLAMLYSPNIAEVGDTIIKIRKALSVVDIPTMSPWIEQGIHKRLMELWVLPEYRFEIAWALTNMASGDIDTTKTLIEDGVILLFTECLRNTENQNLFIQGIWGLGNIAGNDIDSRDLILNSEAMQFILNPNLLNAGIPDLAKNHSWLISNLMRGKPSIPLNLKKEFMPYISFYLSYNEESKMDSLAALSDISNEDYNEICYLAVQYNITPLLIETLNYKTLGCLVSALRTLGNFATGNDNNLDHLISLGLLDALEHLLVHPKIAIRKECLWVLSNIAAGTLHQRHRVLPFLPLVIKIYKQENANDIRNECLFVILNLDWGSDDFIAGQLSNIEVLWVLANELCNRPQDVVNCIEHILNRASTIDRQLHQHFVQALTNYGLPGALMNVQVDTSLRDLFCYN